MALNYHRCAKEIYRQIGGKRNIVSASHCSTRLRLEVVSAKKVNLKGLEQVDGVKGINAEDNQIQLIIGTGTVDRVYEAFENIADLSDGKKKETKVQQGSLFKQILRLPGNVFIPILPVIMGCGILNGLVKLLPQMMPAVTGSTLFSMTEMAAQAMYMFMPVLVSVSTAVQFGGSVYTAVIASLCMMRFDSIPGGIGLSGLLSGGYSGRVMPMILTVLFMIRVEKRLRRQLPENVHLFLAPMITLFVTLILGVGVIGPVAGVMEAAFVSLCEWILSLAGGAAALLVGGLYPLAVIGGSHHILIIPEMGMISKYSGTAANVLMPMISAANFGQFGACLGVALKTRNRRTKAAAFPAAATAAFGITEPALFGINRRHVTPLYMGMIGGAAGAMYASLSHIGSYAFEITGLTGYVVVDKPLAYTIMLVLSGGLAMVLTLLFWKEEKENQEVTLFRTEAGTVPQMVKGEKIPASEIPDPLFAEEAMGPTVGIRPSDGIVSAPFDGTVVMLFPTRHAIGLAAENGMEILIHVGVDTAQLGEKAFISYVEQGAQIHTGEALLKFDRKVIADAGLSDVVTVVLTNADQFSTVEK